MTRIHLTTRGQNVILALMVLWFVGCMWVGIAA